MKRSLFAALALCAPAPALAGEWDFGAEVAAELRYFPNDPTFPGQLEHIQPSFVVQPDIRWETEDRSHQVVIIPFVRVDGQDEERTHFDLREGYYRYNADAGWSLTLGAAKVFWGRTESRHLVDIINQSDTVEDVDEEDKLGQPMANLTLLNDWGTVDLFVMSGFRDRTFPGVDGRPRFGLVVDTDNPIFTRDWRRGAVDVAARYSHYIGNWDFGVSVFHGTSREPRFAIDIPTQRILPVYDKITQGGLDLQYTKDAWLWKFEAIIREGQGEVFFAGVGGFEYTLYQIFGSGFDLGLLAEYQYDGRDEGFVIEDFGPTLAAPVTFADNDVFAGARLAFNDPQDTSMLAGVTVDANDQFLGMFIEAERRLGSSWTAELEARLFLNPDPGNAAFPIRNDDFITFRLTRFF